MPTNPTLAGSEAIIAAIDADAARVHAGTLQAGCAAHFDATLVDEPQGVVLLLHGWSAGPWQYLPLSAALRARGLLTYAARLPGHGACTPDGKEDGRELPLSGQWRDYGACADAAFAAGRALAQAQNVPLYIMGFSGGGALAADLLLRFPQHITRAVLAAPLLRAKGWHHRLLFALLCAIPGAGFITDRINISWGTLPVTPPGGWVRPGHWFFKLGALQSIVRYSLDVWRRAATLRVPTQFIITDLDDKADGKAAQILHGEGEHAHGMLHFSAQEGVPHAMLTAEENPNAQARAVIFTAVERFLLRAERTDEVV